MGARGPSVAVVIPAYNASATIARAVESVLGQTARPDELIVVDDGSKDDAALGRALARFGGEVTLVRQDNGGAARARNTGIATARSDLVAFLDSDDYWEPAKIERQRAIFERYPDVGVVSSRFYWKQPHRPERDRKGTDKTHFLDRRLRVAGPMAFDLGMCLWTCVVMARRELVVNDGFDASLSTAEDLDLWVRLCAKTGVYVLSEPLATYVERKNSLSNADVDRDCRNFRTFLRRHADLLGREGLEEREAQNYRRWAANHLARGNPRAAIRPALERLRMEPLRVEAWRIVAKSSVLAAMPPRLRPKPRQGRP